MNQSARLNTQISSYADTASELNGGEFSILDAASQLEISTVDVSSTSGPFSKQTPPAAEKS